MGTDNEDGRSASGLIRILPVDLVVVLVLVVLTDALILFNPAEESIGLVFVQALLALPFVLFLPGYAFVAALFPEAGRERSGSGADERKRSLVDRIGGVERLVLSVGASIAIAPLIALVLDYTPWGIHLVPVTFSLSAFTVTAVVVGAFRRRALPEDERFTIFRNGTVPFASPSLTGRAKWADIVVNVAVVLAVLLVVSSVVYAVAAPRGGERITEFYLLTRSDTTGELVADDYPTEFVRGESRPLVVGIDNHEGRPIDYSVVVALQRIDDRNGSAVVVEQRQLRRFRVRVGANESRLYPHAVTPPMRGTRLRLTYLLYRGPAPSDPTIENAYREVHLWINVSAPPDSNRTNAHRPGDGNGKSKLAIAARPNRPGPTG